MHILRHIFDCNLPRNYLNWAINNSWVLIKILSFLNEFREQVDPKFREQVDPK